MKFNVKMPGKLKPFYENELATYLEKLKAGQTALAWSHLERAHILGQAFPAQHTFVHWKMLVFGYRIKSLKEVTGQIPRLLVGGVKSFVGTIPVGNTGGANVSALKPMPIPADLKQILEQNK